ncbi:hypothetical protein F5J12DRAFT_872512 [Pisolithus orientalis]|uniref:uncharacterized protein n=1 Tax=Pisolithus orientalis TaxID=936130 RepID=UPI002224DB37|nr:uncharacterized protein F5J12DRAFT_872512 [Pisolithus orientalis]KAI5983560.1 hypothetical protein F5J12DRAFT_872512 [Pisolithus orientalis]
MSGNDCPLNTWSPTRGSGIERGQCSHVFYMHCLPKWLGTPASNQQTPIDRSSLGLSP